MSRSNKNSAKVTSSPTPTRCTDISFTFPINSTVCFCPSIASCLLLALRPVKSTVLASAAKYFSIASRIYDGTGFQTYSFWQKPSYAKASEGKGEVRRIELDSETYSCNMFERYGKRLSPNFTPGSKANYEEQCSAKFCQLLQMQCWQRPYLTQRSVFELLLFLCHIVT